MQWTVPHHTCSSFAVQPQLGLLQGNERQTVTWTFVPTDRSTYDVNVTCSYDSPLRLMPEALEVSASALRQPAAALVRGHAQQLGIRLVGQGTVGALTLEPSSIEFGTVPVGFPAVREITLLNQSGGNLCYSITCAAVAVTEPALSPAAAASAPASQDSMSQAGVGLPNAESALSLSHGAESAISTDEGSNLHLVIEEPQGSLPARATKTLRLTLNPTCRKQYRLQLVCQTATASPPGFQSPSTAQSIAALPANPTAPPVCASVVAFSTYPTVMITDIACEGLAKPFVWSQMACSQVNTELAAEMTQVSICAVWPLAQVCIDRDVTFTWNDFM